MPSQLIKTIAKILWHCEFERRSSHRSEFHNQAGVEPLKHWQELLSWPCWFVWSQIC